MIDELADRIWSHPEFHNEVIGLRRENLRKRILGGDVELKGLKINRLMQAALVLSSSSKVNHRKVSYDIAVSATELLVEEYSTLPHILNCILSRIGNFPAIKYSKNRFPINENLLPIATYIENEVRLKNNTIVINDREVSLTDFQFELWQGLDSGSSVAISAPTSAGKSFILQEYARKQISEKSLKNIAFVVPTRALINQVSDEVSLWIDKLIEAGVELVTTPIPKGISCPESAVYVVTQERLQLLQVAHPDLKFELVVIDEAQSISEGTRGVLLYSVVDEIIERNPAVQLLFAGPNVKNPKGMSGTLKKESKSIKTDEATVSQNIIFIDCDKADSKKANLYLKDNNEKLFLGELNSDQILTDHRSKLINIALQLGKNSQNLVYALGPAECEKVAFGLADTAIDDASKDLLEMSDFIKDAVHPKFQLAQSVINKVGYHYGRLPTIVRKVIEEAFANGKLSYLVTTSTLLYGVNLPAQNLFLHTPQKGDKVPISSNDFWNLAGRAGRLGKEFSGNIFLIDYAEWQSQPMEGEKDVEVRPTFEAHVLERTAELISYINNKDTVPDREKPDEFENTFAKLVVDQLNGNLNRNLDRLGLIDDIIVRNNLKQALANAISASSLDKETIEQAPTVSIHRQDALYSRLEKSLKNKGPEYIIPKHPKDPNAYTSYLAVIKRCHDEILKYKKSDKSHIYYAAMASRWMKGDPLPQIIEKSFEYKSKNGGKPNYPTVIRETLDEIETKMRFKYVRLFACYNAVLELVLKRNGHSNLISSIPAIPMYLEVGANSPTMISFMNIGLSRYTAGKLSDLPRRSDLNAAEAKTWLRKQDLDSLSLPSAAITEIKNVI